MSPCHPVRRTPQWSCPPSVCRCPGAWWGYWGHCSAPCSAAPAAGGIIRHDLTLNILQYLDPVIVVVQEQHPRASHLLGLHHGLEVSQEAHVLAHVRGQHHVYHHLPHTLSLLLWQAGKNVTFIILRKIKMKLLICWWISRMVEITWISLKATARWWFSRTDSSL